MQKYRLLTNETKKYYHITLYRIEALKDFGDVKKGDKGGWVENESNLSQFDNSWIYDNAMAYQNSQVRDNATIRNNAKVYGNSEIFEGANVGDNAHVFGNSKIFGYSLIIGNADVCDNAKVFDGVIVRDDSKVCGNAEVSGDNTQIYGRTRIGGNAVIKSNADYIVFKNNWSSYRYFTWTKSNNMWTAGCFHGTGEELIRKAYEDSDLSGQMYESYVRHVENLMKIEEERSE